MSERQAKKRRQNVVEEVKTNEKSKGNILMNVIIAVIVIAVIGLGAYAIYNKQDENKNQVTVTDADITQDGSIETLKDYAEDIGMTAEDFIKEHGLEGNTEITPETDLYTVFGNMTVENFAKANGRQVEEIIAEFKDEYPDVTKDTIMFDMYATEGATSENE